jgi:hypothetical protein
MSHRGTVDGEESFPSARSSDTRWRAETADTLLALGLLTSPGMTKGGRRVRAVRLIVFLTAGCLARDQLPAKTSSAVTAAAAVLTQHNNNSRTGAYLGETILNTTNVNVSQFGKLFTRLVDGQLYAQPLYVSGVSIAGKGTHDVVYVATENNTVQAFDADDASATLPLWSVSLGPPMPSVDVNCGDLAPLVGITSTPVIDPTTSTLYVVAKTKENGSYFDRLHALDLGSGAEKMGGPVVIQGSVTGSGYDQIGGVITFNSRQQLNRPGLLLTSGTIYIAFGSFCDNDPYHGWVFSYGASTLARLGIYNDTPDSSRAGIWQAGQGLASGDLGDVYFASGNGAFTANTGGRDYGDSVVRLDAAALSVVDWFTPFDQSELDSGDGDLGISGPLIIPGTNAILNGGKFGNYYLLDRNDMGHFNATGDTQILQRVSLSTNIPYAAPIFWNSPAGPRIYLWPARSSLREFAMSGGLIQPTPAATNSNSLPPMGGFLSLSANGSTPGTGLVWALTSPGVLHAFDASDVSRELWNSNQNATRDGLGAFVKFAVPTIAAGKVFASTSSALQVYGLLNGSTGGGGSDGGTSGDAAFVDDFTGTTLGSNWFVAHGAVSVVNGAAVGTAPASYAVWVGTPGADAPVAVTLAPPIAPTYAGVIVRGDPNAPDVTHYAAYVAPDGSVGLARRNNYVYTYLASGPTVSPGTHTIQLTASGAGPVTLTVAVDGATVITAIDSAPQALTLAGRAGIFDYNGASRPLHHFTVGQTSSTGGGGSDGGTSGGAAFIDDFTGTTLGSNWFVAHGAVSVVNGAAVGTGAASYAVWVGTPGADAPVAVTLAPPTAPTDAGVIVRGDPNAPDVAHYAAYFAPDGTVGLARRNNYVYTYLASGPTVSPGTHTIQLTASGAGPVTLTVAVDGATVITAIDSAPQALTLAGRAGIFDYNGTSRPLHHFTVGQTSATGRGP